MNREEMKAYANRVIDLGLNDETQDFCKSVISALSAEGEYIKKSELLQHVTTEELSDFKDCDVIHADEIDELTTYSFPDSAEGEYIERGEALEIIRKNYDLPTRVYRLVSEMTTYSFPDRENDYMKAVRRDCGLYE